MGAPPETPLGPPGLGGLNPSESEQFVLDPGDKEIFRFSMYSFSFWLLDSSEFVSVRSACNCSIDWKRYYVLIRINFYLFQIKSMYF